MCVHSVCGTRGLVYNGNQLGKLSVGSILAYFRTNRRVLHSDHLRIRGEPRSFKDQWWTLNDRRVLNDPSGWPLNDRWFLNDPDAIRHRNNATRRAKVYIQTKSVRARVDHFTLWSLNPTKVVSLSRRLIFLFFFEKFKTFLEHFEYQNVPECTQNRFYRTN